MEDDEAEQVNKIWSGTDINTIDYDLNNHTETGSFFIAHCKNYPTGSNGVGRLIQFKFSGSYTQIYITNGLNDTYIRSLSNHVWLSWSKFNMSNI